MQKTNLNTLDHHCLIHITSFLDYLEVYQLSTTTKYFQFLLTHDAVWRSQLSHLIPLNLLYFDEDFLAQSCKEKFMGIINKYITMRNHLANIARKYDPQNKAEELLKDNFRNNSKEKNEIENIIETTYEKIPLDYYILYRMLNGQVNLGDFEDESPLFGGFTYYQFMYTFHFLPFTKPLEFETLKKYKFLTLTICKYTGNRLFVDIHNVLKRGHGSIFMARSQKNEYGKKYLTVYLFKPSITKFLDDLQYCEYNEHEEILSHFDSFHRPLSDVTTRGIRVRTAAIFNPWDRSYDGELFTYQIRVSPNGVEGKWKLTTRHWIINDNGIPHEVKGPGVIGLYPVVKEGAKEFTYQSCTPMHGFQGSMKGELYFKNQETGEEIPAIVGEAKLGIPQGSALIDLCLDDDSVKVIEESA